MSIYAYIYPFDINVLSFLFYKVTITQAYKNVEEVTIEAQYKFPIHEAAAVCEFEAEIDGQRKIKGIVKEAEEAAKEYTEAIQVINLFKKVFFTYVNRINLACISFFFLARAWRVFIRI